MEKQGTICLGSKSSTTELHPRIVPVLGLEWGLRIRPETSYFVLLRQLLRHYLQSKPSSKDLSRFLFPTDLEPRKVSAVPNQQ